MKNNYSTSKLGIEILVTKRFWRQNWIVHRLVHWHHTINTQYKTKFEKKYSITKKIEREKTSYHEIEKNSLR